MTDTGKQPDGLDEDALRRRLINRIALAGVAIVVLLGGLAVIDSMYVAPTTTSLKIAVAPLIAEAVKPATTVAAPPTATQEKAAEVQTLPEPPKPQAVPTPPEPPKPQAVPTIRKSAEREESAAPSIPLSRQPHLTQSTQAGRHFILQMGVFNNVNNAQDLLAQLQKNGIPAQIEARVQVGPFKTKAEADEARTKLKTMGLDAGLLMAIHR